MIVADESLPDPLSPGDLIYAAWLNQGVAAIEAMRQSIRSGNVAGSSIGALLSALRPEWLVKCRIAFVHLPALAPGEQPRARDVFYDIEGIGRTGVQLAHATPFYGRPVADGAHRIHPARVGMDCALVRGNDAEGQPRSRLYLFEGSEIIARRLCGAGGGVLDAGAGVPAAPPVTVSPVAGVGGPGA